MKKKLLFFTNSNNSNPEEDIFLSNYLKDYFDLILSDVLEFNQNSKNFDIILIRNIWPTEEKRSKLNKLFESIKESRVKVSPSLSGKGDMTGKRYLVDLFNDRYPVIPSIDKINDLSKLGDVKDYFIKPLFGGSSKGCRKVSKKELLETNLDNHIVQPFIDIEKELSFYFIDNKLQYSLFTDDKNDRWNLKSFKPSSEELAFVDKFVKWNALSHGIQRIDVCRTKEGKLLLMEIEDFCPFLSLLDIESKLRESFLKNLVKSLKRLISI